MGDWEQRAIESVRDGAPNPEAIYRAYRGPMMATAARLLGGEHTQTLGLSAEDIVDAVVTDLCAGKVRLKPEIADRLGRYLRGVVANYAKTLMRQRRIDERAMGKQHPMDLTDIEADVETIVLAEQVEERMHLLTERERYVIIENVMKERQVKDVADELGCSPQNISQIRRPALRKLFPEGPFAGGGSSDQHVNGPLHEQEEVR